MAPPSDIVVVGAGIVGCAVAYELARRGASVELIDDRPAGMGATQASAGMLAPFNEAPGGGPLLDIAARGLDVFDSFVGQLADDTGMSLNYQRTGTLDVALDPDGCRHLAETHDILVRRGVVSELLDADGVRAQEPLAPTAAGGLFIPSQGFVGALELTRALVSGARRHGAQVIEHGRVRRVSRDNGETMVQTDRGSLSGDAVVLAAGSWTSQIEVEGATARPPITPIRGQLLQLAWSGPALRRVLWGERCYMVPWHDGTVLVGATVEDVGFDERTTVAGVRDLIAAASALVPRTVAATFVSARAGLRPSTPDHLPIIGRSLGMPNVMYATGHYRNGVLLAPLTARLVADALLDDRVDPILELMTPQRFGDL